MACAVLGTVVKANSVLEELAVVASDMDRMGPLVDGMVSHNTSITALDLRGSSTWGMCAGAMNCSA